MLVIHAVFRMGYKSTGELDALVAGAVLMHLAVGIWVAWYRKFASRFALATYSVLLTLILSEVILGIPLTKPPPAVPQPPIKRVSVAADTMPGITGRIESTVNELGLRGPAVSLDDVDLRILCVGGSTTECRVVTDESSWPWLLQDQLSLRLGKSIFVGNAGVSGQFTLHHLYQLREYALAPRFDYVVMLCGVNDMGTLLRDDYEARRSRVPDQALTRSGPTVYYRESRILRMARYAFRRSRLGVALQDPRGEWYRTGRALRQKALKLRTITQPPTGLPSALETYRANLKEIVAVCRSRNQGLVMLTQPSMYREDLPDELQILLWENVRGRAAYTPGTLQRIIDSYNQVMLDVCRDEGVDCIDLASMLSQDTATFYDDVHFNISGCRKVARILCDHFVRVCADGGSEE